MEEWLKGQNEERQYKLGKYTTTSTIIKMIIIIIVIIIKLSSK